MRGHCNKEDCDFQALDRMTGRLLEIVTGRVATLVKHICFGPLVRRAKTNMKQEQ